MQTVVYLSSPNLGKKGKFSTVQGHNRLKPELHIKGVKSVLVNRVNLCFHLLQTGRLLKQFLVRKLQLI